MHSNAGDIIRPTMPNVVYHYCSLDTFVKILQNKTLRLSNIQKSNDAEEITFITPFVREAVQRVVREFSSRLPQNYKINENAIDIVIAGAFSDLSKNFYVVCFSEHKSLLSQWVRYANDAKGAAIGFNTRYMVDLQIAPYTGYVFGKILYDPRMVEVGVYSFLKKELNDIWDPINHATNQKSIINLVENTLSTMLFYSVLYKNPIFLEEAEWRLVYNPFGRIRKVTRLNTFRDRMRDVYAVKTDKPGFSAKDFGFYASVDTISSYMDLSFSDIFQELICEIIIGPSSKLSNDDKDLIHFLDMYGYTSSNVGREGCVKIEKITAPYVSRSK